MNPNFHVNLGPIKLSHIIDNISAEITGINVNKEFSELVSVDSLKSIESSISFVYENYQDFNEIPRKANLIVSSSQKNKFSEFK